MKIRDEQGKEYEIVEGTIVIKAPEAAKPEQPPEEPPEEPPAQLPVITSLSPTTIESRTGEQVTLKVEAENGKTYKWQIDQGKGWEEINSGTGYTSPTFTTSTRDAQRDDGKKYRVLVSNDAGTTVSDTITLKMGTELVQPVPPTPPPSSGGGSGSGRFLNASFSNSPTIGFGQASAIQAELRKQFGNTRQYSHGESDLAIVSNGNEKYLRQRYRPSSQGSPRVGYLVQLDGQRHAKEMYLSYKLYFEPGWEWVQGGKLPGISGGTAPSGGDTRADGFSSRFMWRKDGTIVVYAYHYAPDRKQNHPYGDDLYLMTTATSSTRYKAPTAQWLTLRQYIKMNSTASAKDGAVVVWVDGVMRLSKQGLRWFGPNSKPPSGWGTSNGLPYGAGQLFVSSFYGGASSSWSPKKTTYARFDDFKMGPTINDVD